MNDRELTEILLRLEGRITILEKHYHTYTDFDGRLGSKVRTKTTSRPKIQSSEQRANKND